MGARALAMVAQQRHVKLIFDELLGIDGCNVCLVPAEEYVQPHEKVSFMALAKRLASKRCILIGSQKRGGLPGEGVLNPDNKCEPCGWTGYDLAVLAGDTI